MLTQLIATVFDDLSGMIGQLTDAQYTGRCNHLSRGTIGQHVRHTIELFQCLLNGYNTGTINYECRKRDLKIETDKKLAGKMIAEIVAETVSLADRPLLLEVQLGMAGTMQMTTNYYRELVYNIEHAIHHMALMRVGVIEISDIVLPETFGVAPATIQYRKSCAQ